jgi:hypothetical protein
LIDDAEHVLVVALPPNIVEFQETPTGVLLREGPMTRGVFQDVPEFAQQVGFPGGRRRVKRLSNRGINFPATIIRSLETLNPTCKSQPAPDTA